MKLKFYECVWINFPDLIHLCENFLCDHQAMMNTSLIGTLIKKEKKGKYQYLMYDNNRY